MVQTEWQAPQLAEPASTNVRQPITVRYVPSLLDRRGERTALRMLADTEWARTTPLIRIAPASVDDRNTRNANVKVWAAHLAASVAGHSVLLDPRGLEGEGGGGHLPLVAAYETCRRAGIAFTPVHTFGDGHSLIAARTAGSEASGLALRYQPTQTALAGASRLADAVGRELERLEIQPRSVDLLIDLGWIDPDRPISAGDLSSVLTTLRVVGLWRSTVLMGTTVPSTLRAFPEGLLSGFRRRELALWSELRDGGFPDLDFGDHGVQNPRPPDLRNARYMRASIRYTIGDATLIARGVGALLDLPLTERFAQYRELSRLLFEHPLFPRTDCCEADRVIQECSDAKRHIQAQHIWRGLATLHHTRITVAQVSDFDVVPAIATRDNVQPTAVPVRHT